MISEETTQSILAKIEALSGCSNRGQFLDAVINILADHLRYALVGVFLLDTSKQLFIFKAGTGVVGREFVERGYQIPVNKSSNLVGAMTPQEIRISNGWSAKIYECLLPADIQPNSQLEFQLFAFYPEVLEARQSRMMSPLLPEKIWEICLPLRFEAQLLGVLYFHVDIPPDFSPEDCAPLQWLADQISTRLVDT